MWTKTQRLISCSHQQLVALAFHAKSCCYVVQEKDALVAQVMRLMLFKQQKSPDVPVKRAEITGTTMCHQKSLLALVDAPLDWIACILQPHQRQTKPNKFGRNFSQGHAAGRGDQCRVQRREEAQSRHSHHSRGAAPVLSLAGPGNEGGQDEERAGCLAGQSGSWCAVVFAFLHACSQARPFYFVLTAAGSVSLIDNFYEPGTQALQELWEDSWQAKQLHAAHDDALTRRPGQQQLLCSL